MPHRAAEQQLALLEEKLGVGIWSWHAETGALSWSPGLCRILGIDRNVLQPSFSLFESLTHCSDRLDAASLRSFAMDSRQRDRSFRIQRQDGALRWVRNLAQSYGDTQGRVARVVAVVADVTELEEARASLRFGATFTDAVADLLGTTFWMQDEQGEVVAFSNRKEIRNPTSQRALATHWHEIVHPDDLAGLLDRQALAKANGSQVLGSHRINISGEGYQRIFDRSQAVTDPISLEHFLVGVGSLHLSRSTWPRHRNAQWWRLCQRAKFERRAPILAGRR